MDRYYIQGFMDKFAAAGINPEVLAKTIARLGELSREEIVAKGLKHIQLPDQPVVHKIHKPSLLDDILAQGGYGPISSRRLAALQTNAERAEQIRAELNRSNLVHTPRPKPEVKRETVLQMAPTQQAPKSYKANPFAGLQLITRVKK